MRPAKQLYILCTVSVVVALGCNSETGLASREVEIEIGTGVDRFTTLQDGESVTLGEGAQGGYHLWAALRMSGLHPDNVDLEIATLPTLSQRPLQRTYLRVDFDPGGVHGKHEALGLRLVLSYPECHVGRDVEIRVRASDIDGRTGSASQVVRAEHPDRFATCVL